MIFGDDVLSSGLVHRFMYRTEFDSMLVHRMTDKVPDEDFKLSDFATSMRKYVNDKYDKTESKSKDKIALIIAEGNISSGRGKSNPFSSEKGIYSVSLSKLIDEAANDKNIKAIVLRINSGGGSAHASDVIWNSLVRAKSKKPLIVSMDGAAASGGYYLSMPADTIFAGKNTVTGSIGVFGGKPYIAGLMKKAGITTQVFKKGEYSEIFSTFTRPWTESEKTLMTKSIEHIYDVFTKKAANGRHTSQEYIDSVGQGHIYSGERALKIGLVDKIGGVWDAIDCAKNMAGLSDAGITVYPKEKTFWDVIDELEKQASTGFKTSVFSQFFEFFGVKSTENPFTGYKAGEPLLICPVEITGDNPVIY
jgi:protease-4